MLVDAHDSIRAAYPYMQMSIDKLERPCWIIVPDGNGYTESVANLVVEDLSYTLAFIGYPMSTTNSQISAEFEKSTRQILIDTEQYLLENQQMSVTNRRGLFSSAKPSLDDVLWLQIGSKSAVELFSREGVSGEAWWGFTLSVNIRHVIHYCETFVSTV
ncbi:MAG: hypothetical protein D6712_10610 [Chloroflexi bacterium]|nr:MAG: hypothetical protein D6712_10610 [Chloroflexota bacterium]